MFSKIINSSTALSVGDWIMFDHANNIFAFRFSSRTVPMP